MYVLVCYTSHSTIVTCLIIGTLFESHGFTAGEWRENAVGWADHNWYFANKNSFQQFLISLLLQMHVIYICDSVIEWMIRVCNHGGLANIHKQWCRVCEIAQAGFLWCNSSRRSICFLKQWTGQVYLTKFYTMTTLHTIIILCGRVK